MNKVLRATLATTAATLFLASLLFLFAPNPLGAPDFQNPKNFPYRVEQWDEEVLVNWWFAPAPPIFKSRHVIVVKNEKGLMILRGNRFQIVELDNASTFD